MKIAFSKEGEAAFLDILSRYPRKDAALLPVLWLAQKEFGFLSSEAKAYVCEKLDLPLARVESVVSFYTLYKNKPTGKFHFQVCRNISCALQGADKVISKIQERFGVKQGEVTSDGKFSYELVECLAACGGAPALQVNLEYHERITLEKVEKIIERFERGSDR